MDFTNAFWSPFKELLSTVEYTIYHKRVDLVHEYQNLLKQHKTNFTRLLKFPPRNAKDRAELNRGPKEGAVLSANTPPKKIPLSLVQEVILLSDVLDLNEFSSLELLLVGQDQTSRYAGWSRGLVATVLYHDGRRSLLTALKTVLQAKQGQSWSIILPEEVNRFTQEYIAMLLDNGLVKQIFDLLRGIDVQNELSRLERGGGVGDQKHRALLSSLIHDQRQILSDCLLTLSCQEPLNKVSCLELLRYLREVPQVLGDGTLDTVSLSLLFSFIASVDVGHLLEKETGDELTLNEYFPVLSDPTFIPDVTEELKKDSEWKCKELKACVLFTWAQLLRICAPASPFSELQEVESDEQLTDTAINLGLFRFLTNGVIGSDGFHNEELYLRKLHQLISSFIVNMPLKIKEMSTRTEEILFYQSKLSPTREEDADNISRDYQEFLLAIGALYGLDPLSLELSRDYWQVATASHVSAVDSLALSNYSRPSAKQTALFNFVRSCGEHLHPSMFTVYLTMLNGLSCGPTSAQHCFALLRAFSSYTGSYVSLDHLFNSMKQYADSFGRHGTSAQLHMTSVELEGMKAVLKLLTSLAYWDQTVRISLVEHPTWQSLHVLTALVACPVPCSLKAEIFRLLANLNKTQEVGIVTWQDLESINIIGRPDALSKTEHGITLELEKIESRNETYPETRGFLRLLDELTNHPLPDKLQFSSYLDFLIDTLFLQSDKLTYSDPDEKWEMLSDVLQILHKFVKNYSPESHPPTPDTMAQSRASPAAAILMKLLYDSPFLHQLLTMLHAGYKILKGEENVRAAKSHFVDRACLLSLQLVEEGLEKGEGFRNLNQGAGSYALLSPLDSLLLGINPKTNRADHLLVITLFVSLQLFSPELSLSAVNILCLVSSSSAVAKQLCPILTQDPLLTTEIMSGFVQRVEVEDWETYEESDILSKEDKSVTSSITSSQIRIRILQLILLNINVPAPNLAHLLLGFETKAPVKHTILQDPGIADNPRTCLHSILYLISPPPTVNNHFTCHSYAPRFSMLAYQVLYTLCSHSDLSASTLRYLRSSKNFFFSQLEAVPFFPTTQHEVEVRAPSLQLELSLQHQQSWLLRMVAIELHLTTRKQQRSHTQKLINLLLSDEKEAPVQIPVKKDVKSFRAVEEEVISLPSTASRTLKKLSVILSKMDLSDVSTSSLELSYFKEDQILHLIQQHLARSELFEMNIIDIKSLHRFINQEMMTAQIAVSQKPHVFEETRHVLSFALEQNQAREQMEIKKHLFESWNQMTDILLLSCPEELLPREIRFPLLLELAQLILDKALSGDVIIEVIPSLTRSLLTIFSHLALLHSQCLRDSAVSISIDTPTMKPLLTSILDILSHADRSVHATRINLYGVLLYYFQMCRRRVEETESQDIYMQEDRGNSLESMTMSMLNAYGDSLIGVVCRDALDSNNIAQTLAFSLMEQILLFDEDLHWLKTLSVQGYLRHIVDSMGKQDGELVEGIRHGSSTVGLLFYQAKISFLTRVAMCIRGPELLSQANLFYTLSNMSYIDLRPEVGILQPVSNSPNSKAIQTYSQLLLPTLRLLLTVLSSAAKRHYDIVFQVTQFVSSHSEVIFSILGSHANTYTIEYFQEMSLVTSLVSLSCAHYMHQSAAAEMTEEPTSEPLKALCLRVQRLVLNLLPTYCLISHTAKLVQQLNIQEGRDAESAKREALLYILQTANSILRYAVVTMNKDGLEIEMTTPKIMFNIDIASAGSAIHERAHLPTSTLSMGTLLKIIDDHSNNLVLEFDNLNKSERLLSAHIIESALYLFWKHLEFYLVFAYDRNNAVGGAGRYLGDPYQKLQTTSGFIPEPRLNKFKQELENLLTPSFFTQLQQVEEKIWISEPGALPQARFLDTTIQNIKKLVSQKTQGN